MSRLLEFTDLKELIMHWAGKRTEPFLTSDVFTQIDEALDLKQASDGLRRLYLEGLIGRKKIDGFRFAYALPAYAPQDFEWASPKAEEPGEGLDASATILEMAKEQLGQKPLLSAPSETKPPVNLTAIRKPETKHKKAAEKLPKTVGADSIRPNIPDDAIQPQIGEIKIPVPENFVLSLQTPGGLVITIKTGIL